MLFFLDKYTEGIDIVGRQENLNKDLDQILATHNIRHTKRVNSRTFVPRLSQNTIREFMKSHENVLTKYNYNYIPSDIEVSS